MIDESLAEQFGFDDLESLRKIIAGQIQREYDGVSRMRIKRDLLDQLAKGADFPVPPSMVEAEFNGIWTRVESDRKEGKGDDEDKDKDDETLKGEYRVIAERRVRLGLLLSEIGRQNGVQVGADELQRAMRAEAARYQGQEAQVMEFFRKNPQAADGLRGPIFEDKTVDFILESANVETKVVTPEELSAEPEGSPAQADPGTSEPSEPASGEAAAVAAPAATADHVPEVSKPSDPVADEAAAGEAPATDSAAASHAEHPGA